VLAFELVLLLFLVNGAPIIARRLLGRRWASPVDGGRTLSDGRPLFGPAKTWRGLVFAVGAGALGGAFMGFGAGPGVLVGVLAMAGDLGASFLKRRLGLAPSSRALGLDQVPESLLPMLACKFLLGMSWMSVVAVVAGFTFGGLLISKGLYLLGVRERPY